MMECFQYCTIIANKESNMKTTSYTVTVWMIAIMPRTYPHFPEFHVFVDVKNWGTVTGNLVLGCPQDACYDSILYVVEPCCQ